MAAIYGEAIASSISTMDDDNVGLADMKHKLEFLGSREAAVVATGDGVVGFGWLKGYSDRAGYRYACETSVYLGRTVWGAGLGDLLQAALLDQARAFCYRHVVAKILALNERSLRFHARHGFELVGVQRAIGKVDDRWVDVSILQRILD